MEAHGSVGGAIALRGSLGKACALFLATNVLALSTYRAIRQALVQPHSLYGFPSASRPLDQRIQNERIHRSFALLCAILCIAGSTWAHFLNPPADAQSGQPLVLGRAQIVGLLLEGLYGLSACWCAAAAFLHSSHTPLAVSRPISSVTTFAFMVLHCTWNQLADGAGRSSLCQFTLLHGLYWMLDGMPATTFMPILLSACSLHAVAEFRGSTVWLLLTAVLLMYLLMGCLHSKLYDFLSSMVRPSELPSTLFGMACSVSGIATVLSLLLCNRRIVELLLDHAARRTSWVAVACTGLVQAPQDHNSHGYGLRLDIMISITLSLACLITNSSLVLSLTEPPVKDKPFQLAVLMEQHPITQSLLASLRSLSAAKQNTVCLMLTLGEMQVAATVYMGLQLLLAPALPQASTSSMPLLALLLIMLGMVLQVSGAVHLSSRPITDLTPSSSLPSSAQQPNPWPEHLSPSSSMSGTPTISQERSSRHGSAFEQPWAFTEAMEESTNELTRNEFHEQTLQERANALSDLKIFMQGLDQQPGVYSIEEFIQGSARALQDVFPGISHASFCLLNSTYATCNVYTFLAGNSPYTPPRNNVAVVPNTLVHRVLMTCEPLFINTTKAAPGKYTDLQFLRLVQGLESVACLPLMSRTHMQGVLCLGYSVPVEWDGLEQNLAKQLALVFSRSTNSMDCSSDQYWQQQQQQEQQQQDYAESPHMPYYQQASPFEGASTDASIDPQQHWHQEQQQLQAYFDSLKSPPLHSRSGHLRHHRSDGTTTPPHQLPTSPPLPPRTRTSPTRSLSARLHSRDRSRAERASSFCRTRLSRTTSARDLAALWASGVQQEQHAHTMRKVLQTHPFFDNAYDASSHWQHRPGHLNADTESARMAITEEEGPVAAPPLPPHVHTPSRDADHPHHHRRRHHHHPHHQHSGTPRTLPANASPFTQHTQDGHLGAQMSSWQQHALEQQQQQQQELQEDFMHDAQNAGGLGMLGRLSASAFHSELPPGSMTPAQLLTQGSLQQQWQELEEQARQEDVWWQQGGGRAGWPHAAGGGPSQPWYPATCPPSPASYPPSPAPWQQPLVSAGMTQQPFVSSGMAQQPLVSAGMAEQQLQDVWGDAQQAAHGAWSQQHSPWLGGSQHGAWAWGGGEHTGGGRATAAHSLWSRSGTPMFSASPSNSAASTPRGGVQGSNGLSSGPHWGADAWIMPHFPHDPFQSTGSNACWPPPQQQPHYLYGGDNNNDSISMYNSRNPHSDILLLGLIGRGGFGSVYKALWHNMLVAIKVLEHGDEFMGCTDDGGDRDLVVDASGRRAALLEGAMTSTIKHPNVVQTYDYRVVHLSQEPPQQPGFLTPHKVVQETHIIMEYCDRGSLQDAMKQDAFLLSNSTAAGSGHRSRRWQGRRRSIPEKGHALAHALDAGHESRAAGAGGSSRAKAGEEEQGSPNEETDEEDSGPAVDLEALSMTLAEVAAAMAYLHAHRITHRDLKPKNILLRASDKDRRGFVAKVSDFGLAQVLPEGTRTQVSQRYGGTVTHMPPELIEDGKVYQQGDVYAFGIMMWELYTGSMPYPNMAHPQIMVAVVTHNLRPKFPSSCPEWFKSLAYKCWRKDPKLRPSFAEITAHLGQVLRNAGEWGAAGDSQENMGENLGQNLESMGLICQSDLGAQPEADGEDEGGA